MAEKKHLLHSIHHCLTAAVLIIKGIDKIPHHAFIGSLILLFGVIILAYFIFTVIKKHPDKHLEPGVRWFEALVALFMAYIFFSEGKSILPYAWLLAAIGFFISIYVYYKNTAVVPQK